MFHDAWVDKFTVLDDELRMETDEFSFGPEEKMLPARILIQNIRAIYRNDQLVDAFVIESDDAEIYGLTDTPEEVQLILIWHWGPKEPTVFAVYRFPFAKLHTEDLAGGPVRLVPDTEPL